MSDGLHYMGKIWGIFRQLKKQQWFFRQSRRKHMNMKKKGGRALKQQILTLLNSEDLATAEESLKNVPARKIINILLSFLQNTDPKIKWTAVSLMGTFVHKIADENIEDARVIMRRLMWNLNDESGGIGWGSPEAMGEILARHKRLAKEYSNILLSYAREDGNYLEHEMLQRGLLWGIGRLGQKRPDLVKNSAQYIVPYLESTDAIKRGLAIWIVGMLGGEDVRPILEKLKEDEAEIHLYLDQRFIDIRIKDLALEAIASIDPNVA